MRNFENWLSTFRASIADYGYYVDFEKIYENVDAIKVELNILNSLIGSENIEIDFENLIRKYPRGIELYSFTFGSKGKGDILSR